MFKLRCIVERITYQNPQNGYSVMKVKIKGYNDLVTLVAISLRCLLGACCCVTGSGRSTNDMVASSSASQGRR